MYESIQSSRVVTATFFAVLMLLPFGVAMQNIGITVAFVTMVLSNGARLGFGKVQLDRSLKRATLAITGMIAVTGWSSAMNVIAAPGLVAQYLMGHVSFYAFPLLFLAASGRILEWKKEAVGTGILLLSVGAIFWLAVIGSQWLWGWKVAGIKIVFDESFRRARGFYSHPLTLGYVALIILPSVLYYFKINWRKASSWCFLCVEVGALYFSMSRTVQAVSLLLFLWFISTTRSLKLRIVLWFSSFALIAVILTTPNLISQRLRNILDGESRQWSEEKESQYADDRLAFWHVHWNMIKERPFLGHGAFLDQAYRRPYYAAIGLPGFKKAYEAHNQYLQILTEGGALSLTLFFMWIYYLFRWCASLPAGFKRVGYQTIVGFLLGGLTQNAFHDSEVRFSLMCVFLIGIMFHLFSIDPASTSPKEVL